MLILQTPWTRQPQIAARPSVDAASRLLGLWLPGIGDVSGSRDAGRNIQSSGVDGKAWFSAGLTIALASTSEWVPSSDGFSLLVRLEYGSLGTGKGVGIVTATVGERAALFLGTASTLIFDYGGASGGTTRITATVSTAVGRLTTYIATTGPRGMELWNDGVKIANNAANPTRGGTTSKAVAIGNIYGGSSGSSKYFVAAAWADQLSEQLAENFSRNPWQLFQPRRIYIPTSTAAATTPTLSALTAISITSTSAQPSLTYTY